MRRDDDEVCFLVGGGVEHAFRDGPAGGPHQKAHVRDSGSGGKLIQSLLSTSRIVARQCLTLFWACQAACKHRLRHGIIDVQEHKVSLLAKGQRPDQRGGGRVGFKVGGQQNATIGADRNRIRDQNRQTAAADDTINGGALEFVEEEAATMRTDDDQLRLGLFRGTDDLFERLAEAKGGSAFDAVHFGDRPLELGQKSGNLAQFRIETSWLLVVDHFDQ